MSLMISEQSSCGEDLQRQQDRDLPHEHAEVFPTGAS
jgi:hypothetical protein